MIAGLGDAVRSMEPADSALHRTASLHRLAFTVRGPG
ncbi:hypothetical protein DFJ69_6351 [Thermomonospora umbrina]|uniref:Uncharacterized protein n=1 Tax=Thermomonospora umbrina TaxID=111806 RepID=A0A3D9SXT7_9ACTN|nr:hypothetical protein DFJ69_6351 [Thermomonospora umbrina]